MTDEQKAEFRQLNKECGEVSGLTHDDISNSFSGNHSDLDKEKAKKHLVCIAKKVHYLNEDGTLNAERIRQRALEHSANPAEVEKVVNCAVQKGTPEETVGHFFKCKHEAVGSPSVNH